MFVYIWFDRWFQKNCLILYTFATDSVVKLSSRCAWWLISPKLYHRRTKEAIYKTNRFWQHRFCIASNLVVAIILYLYQYLYIFWKTRAKILSDSLLFIVRSRFNSQSVLYICTATELTSFTKRPRGWSKVFRGNVEAPFTELFGNVLDAIFSSDRSSSEKTYRNP